MNVIKQLRDVPGYISPLKGKLWEPGSSVVKMPAASPDN